MNKTSATQVSTSGWTDTIKEYVPLDTISQKVNLSSQQLLEIIIYLGVSFFCGFLFKRYFQFIIVGIIASIIALIALESIDIITIDWVQLRALTGVNPEETLGGLLAQCIDLVKEHIMLVVSMVIGFLIGYKVG